MKGSLLSVLLFGVVALTGCVTNGKYGRVKYDYRAANAPGTIVLSEPRVFSREDLINERARDVTYIKSLIEDSEDPSKIKFKPDIIREVETLIAAAAAIGIKSDPLAGEVSRRNDEADDVLGEIRQLRIEHALEQLRRDVEIRRGQFANQAEPVNSGLGLVEEDPSTEGDKPTISAIDQLKSSIDKLLTEISGRLDADAKKAATTDVVSNPFDEYRDRSAYRGMLKGELNSAGLDQLHDAGNARLMRLNFEASVVPVEKYLRSLGAVQVKINPPKEGGLTRDVLNNWLAHFNQHKSNRAGAALSFDPAVTEFIASGSFEAVDINGITLILPVMLDALGREWTPSQMLRRSQWDLPEQNDINLFDRARNHFGIDTEKSNRIVFAICTQSLDVKESDDVEEALILARDRDITHSFYLLADRIARSHSLPSPLTANIASKIDRSRTYERMVKDKLRRDPNCERYYYQQYTLPTWRAFADASGKATTARVYQVGPREQAQQVSSVVRSANSLALAASIAASEPRSGLAADAAASYSQQSMVRAMAMERASLVSGYAVGGNQAFGWVFGPRAILTPRGTVEMEQALETYDVWADVSIPGWWADFELEAVAVWAPSPESIARGTLHSREKVQTQKIPVKLVRSPADYDAISNYLSSVLIRGVSIDAVEGGPVNACTPTILWVTGNNIWRAESALVLGQLIRRDKLTIAPDMKGIFIEVPPISFTSNPKLSLSVITPLGPSTFKDVSYASQPSGDGCKQARAVTAKPDPNAITIKSISPALDFLVPSKFEITVLGSNLNKIVSVQLHGQAGALVAKPDGKMLSIAFDDVATSSIPYSDNISLRFLDADGEVIETRNVRTSQKK